MTRTPNFKGDDDIDWSEHAEQQIKLGMQDFQPKNLDYFADLIPPEALVLDFGCNIGRWAKAIVGNGWNYVGLDASETALELAHDYYTTYCLEKKIPQSIYFIHSNGLNMTEHDILTKDSFDLIFTNAVLQHIHNVHKTRILINMFYLLKPGGHLVIQEVVDAKNIRAGDRSWWINEIEDVGFSFLKHTEPNDTRNGFVFRKPLKE